MRRHPVRSTAVAVVLGLAAAEGIGFAVNPAADVPGGACKSPFAESNMYKGDPGTSLYLQTYTGAFTDGVVAEGIVPQDALGVQASFNSPDGRPDAWEVNGSSMVLPDKTGKFALKAAIGPGDVRFAVRIIAPAGSAACDGVPGVAYTLLRGWDFMRADGAVPWQNPVNVPINLLSAG